MLHVERNFLVFLPVDYFNIFFFYSSAFECISLYDSFFLVAVLCYIYIMHSLLVVYVLSSNEMQMLSLAILSLNCKCLRCFLPVYDMSVL